MGLKLKVCGMKYPENMGEVAALSPDYLGFIFYEKSPRNFEDEICEMSATIKKTGVFVNASVELILEKAKKYDLSAIQLHGNETPEFCRYLKRAFQKEIFSAEVIKVFSVKDEFDFKVLEPYEGVVDFFLFDTKGKNKGGNGITFNWEVLKAYPSPTPFFLSGGIGPEEVAEVKKLYLHFQKGQNPHVFYAVDVNSKFETTPGFKNPEKIKIFKDSLLSKST